MWVESEEEHNLFRCKVKSCIYASNTFEQIKRHEAKCRNTPIYECSQKVYKMPEDQARTELENEGVLPAQYHNMHYAVYDIATVHF